jgi:hypothetical protein
MTAVINDILTITNNIKFICMTSDITWFISMEKLTIVLKCQALCSK